MFLVSLIPKELTPCKISRICRNAFNAELVIFKEMPTNEPKAKIERQLAKAEAKISICLA